MVRMRNHNGETLGEVFTNAKEARGNTFGDVRDYLLMEHGIRVTNQTVANYHQDRIGGPDAAIVAGITAYYGLLRSDLPPTARGLCERAERVLVLIGGGAGDRGPGGGDETAKWVARDSNPEPAESMPVAA